MMPLIKTRYAIAAVLAMALATIPATLTAQEADAPVVEDAATAPVSDSTSAEERATAQVPDTAVEIEMDRRFNEFRSKYLDDRAEYINRWLAVVAIVLTFFGVVVTIAGYIGYKKFRDIESEAHGYIEEIRAHKNKAEKDSQAIKNIMLTSQDVADSTKAKQVEQTVIDARQSPEASHIDKARAEAYSLQQEGKIKGAIEKWRSIANFMEGIDNEVAARAWFSIGYLYQKGKPEVAEKPDSLCKAIDAYNEAIRLDPDDAAAYNNRGNAKSNLEQYEEAIADYNQAIRLDPDYAVAYYSRAIANIALDRIETAGADLQTALALAQETGDEKLTTAISAKLQ